MFNLIMIGILQIYDPKLMMKILVLIQPLRVMAARVMTARVMEARAPYSELHAAPHLQYHLHQTLEMPHPQNTCPRVCFPKRMLICKHMVQIKQCLVL